MKNEGDDIPLDKNPLASFGNGVYSEERGRTDYSVQQQSHRSLRSDMQRLTHDPKSEMV